MPMNFRLRPGPPSSRDHVLQFRAAKNWTQKQAAAWWGCSERSWQRYESGDRSVPAPLLKRIAKSLPRNG